MSRSPSPVVVAFSLSTKISPDVSVSIKKRIPNVVPTEAHGAWLEYTWKNGGGLPIFVITNSDKKLEEDDDYAVSEGGYAIDSRFSASTRTLIPLFAEEKLVKTTLDNDDLMIPEGDQPLVVLQQYRLTKLGPIWNSELKANSHLGNVSFSQYTEDIDGARIKGTEIDWSVSFDVLERQALWQQVTEQTISDACNNLASYLTDPITLTVNFVIDISNENESPYNIKSLTNQWIRFVWRNGGGLPLPFPPIPLNRSGYDRILIPPFLRETILNVDDTNNSKTEILYKVMNPSFLTYPVHDHLGKVTFQETSSDQVAVMWEVCVKPMRGFESFVKIFTETVVETLSKNFKTHIEKPGEDVDLRLPIGEKRPSLRISMDTWLGSVISDCLNDTRSLDEQIIGLFQPWTWGRIKGNFESTWSIGEMNSTYWSN